MQYYASWGWDGSCRDNKVFEEIQGDYMVVAMDHI